jgi:hypothetical protein
MFSEKLFRRCFENFDKTVVRGRMNGLLRNACRAPVFACATAVLFLGQLSGHAASAWETNGFTSSLGNWSLELNNTANGNNVQWVNSSHAGGAAGELGGTFTRHTSLAYEARYFDGATFSLNDELWARGSFAFTNTGLTWNGLNPYVAYFNTADVSNNRFGFRILEPTSGGTADYRARLRVNGTQQATTAALFVQGTAYDFEFHWVPSGLNDGSGTYSGNIGPYTFTNIYAAQPVGSYDAFGIYWAESADQITNTVDGFFDDLEYLVPVPEPSAIWLGALGLVTLGVTQRVRNWRRK